MVTLYMCVTVAGCAALGDAGSGGWWWMPAESISKKKPRNYAGLDGFRRLVWLRVDGQMVEAAGIEPASEDATSLDLHA